MPVFAQLSSWHVKDTFIHFQSGERKHYALFCMCARRSAQNANDSKISCSNKNLCITANLPHSEILCMESGLLSFSLRPHVDSGIPVDEESTGFSPDVSPGWLGFLLRRHQGVVGSDMKKSRANLMGFSKNCCSTNISISHLPSGFSWVNGS